MFSERGLKVGVCFTDDNNPATRSKGNKGKALAVLLVRPEEPAKKICTVWSAFEPDREYFGPGRQTFMINYRVANLKKVLAQLKKEGVWVDPKTEDSEFGKFGWIKDGEGNRIELWEPPKGM